MPRTDGQTDRPTNRRTERLLEATQPSLKSNTGEIVTSAKRCKIDRKIHLKYVDDFSMAKSINFKKQLVYNPLIMKPEQYHERTGHMLPSKNSKIFNQLVETKGMLRLT